MIEVLRPDKLLKAQNLVGGKFVNPSGKKIEVRSPYFGEVVGETADSSVEDLSNIIEHAKTALQVWQTTPIKERTQILFRWREILLKNIGAIAQVISLENGKTPQEASAGVMKGLEVLEFALSLQNLDSGARMEVSRGVFCEYRREAVGIVASITPFNFPAMVPMWTIPIALVLGNAMIWKPSEKTPLTAQLIGQSLIDAGLPAGVFSIFHGGATAVNAILERPEIQAVSFVGSSKIAKLVYTEGSKHGKRVLALGGAKNHIVLLPDADAQMAGRGISDSFTGCAGQRCMAASVLLAVGDVEKQIEQIVLTAKKTIPSENMGAIITKNQVEFLNQAIERAKNNGAKILLDGRNPKIKNDFKNGNWLGPTILDQVTPTSEAACDELFGPILSIVRCQNISQAMEIENANPYGNAASVFTKSSAHAELVIQKAKAAMVGVNIGVPVPREPFSFGGMNLSKFGHGDITGESSLNFWSNLKKVTSKWESHHDHNWMS